MDNEDTSKWLAERLRDALAAEPGCEFALGSTLGGTVALEGEFNLIRVAEQLLFEIGAAQKLQKS